MSAFTEYAIEEAQKKEEEIFKITRDNLKIIPKSIIKLINLKCLIISNESIERANSNWLSLTNYLQVPNLEKEDELNFENLEIRRLGKIYPQEGDNDFSDEDFSFLKNLPNLNTLILKSIQINIDFLLENASGLKYIEFIDVEVKQPIVDISLRNIEFINLTSVYSLDLTFFRFFPNLKSIIFRDTNIDNYNFIEYLSNLEELSLPNCKISSIDFLKKSKRLKRLSLKNNNLENIEGIELLTELEELDISSNPIINILPLQKLKSLKYLNFYNLNITKIDFNTYNFLREFYPKTIDELKRLKNSTVEVQHYEEAAGIRDIEKMAIACSVPEYAIQITEIYDKFNKIGKIDYSKIDRNNFDSYDKKINYIEIKNKIVIDNIYKLVPKLLFKRIISPPKEIIDQGHEAILAYFESLEEAKKQDIELVPINEIKIILVGEGLSGKTSLLKKIKGLPFKESESQTHGIIIDKFKLGSFSSFKRFKQLSEVTGRFWDFGGQEIMHSSHQFFLSSRSIYILLVDSRTDARKEYWLKHIQKYSNNSPTIVAINKIDENRSYDIERQLLSKKYPFVDKRFHRISCKTNEGIDNLFEELADLIPKSEISKVLFNPSWLVIKEALEKETTDKNYIDQRFFKNICIENGVNNETEQNILLNYLDSLGIALHFEKLGLANFYVLDPHWVTIAVYKIINSQVIEDGLLKESLIDFILNEELVKKEEYDPAKSKVIKYSSSEQAYIIKIMEEFELLYKYDNKSYLVPDLLPKEPRKTIDFNDNNADNIFFIVRYDFLPISIISRFIIRMKEDVMDINCLWRTGVKLQNKEMKSIALIKADLEEKKISICVAGEAKFKRDYFSVIRHSLSSINNSYDDLVIKESIPIFGYPEIEIELNELIGHEIAGKDDIFIGKIGKYFSVSKDFLDKYVERNERQSLYMPLISEPISIMQGDDNSSKKSNNETKNANNVDQSFFIKRINPWMYVLFSVIIFTIFIFYASSGSELNILGFNVKKGSQKTSTTAESNSPKKVTIIGSIMYGSRFPKSEEVKQVYVRGLTISPRVSMDNNAFILRNIDIPSDKIVRIGVVFNNNAIASSLLKLPEPDVDKVCDLGEILLDVKDANIVGKKDKRMRNLNIIIRNQNIQNN